MTKPSLKCGKCGKELSGEEIYQNSGRFWHKKEGWEVPARCGPVNVKEIDTEWGDVLEVLKKQMMELQEDLEHMHAAYMRGAPLSDSMEEKEEKIKDLIDANVKQLDNNASLSAIIDFERSAKIKAYMEIESLKSKVARMEIQVEGKGKTGYDLYQRQYVLGLERKVKSLKETHFALVEHHRVIHHT